MAIGGNNFLNIMIKNPILIFISSTAFLFILGVASYYFTFGYWKSNNSLFVSCFLCLIICGALYSLFYFLGILKYKIVQWIPFFFTLTYFIVMSLIHNKLWNSDINENLCITKGVIYKCRPHGETSGFDAKINFIYEGLNYSSTLSYENRDDYKVGDSVIIHFSSIHPKVNEVETDTSIQIKTLKQ